MAESGLVFPVGTGHNIGYQVYCEDNYGKVGNYKGIAYSTALNLSFYSGVDSSIPPNSIIDYDIKEKPEQNYGGLLVLSYSGIISARSPVYINIRFQTEGGYSSTRTYTFSSDPTNSGTWNIYNVTPQIQELVDHPDFQGTGPDSVFTIYLSDAGNGFDHYLLIDNKATLSFAFIPPDEVPSISSSSSSSVSESFSSSSKSSSSRSSSSRSFVMPVTFKPCFNIDSTSTNMFEIDYLRNQYVNLYNFRESVNIDSTSANIFEIDYLRNQYIRLPQFRESAVKNISKNHPKKRF